MGGSFRPLTGIVPHIRPIPVGRALFSPPYGDGTAADVHQTRSNLFSPPYGDGTIVVADAIRLVEFSPPYGDDPLSHGLRRASSPERGSLVQGNGSCKSSPFGRAGAQRLRGFCGDKLKYHENRLLPVL